jgi:hypothetical protein
VKCRGVYGKRKDEEAEKKFRNCSFNPKHSLTAVSVLVYFELWKIATPIEVQESWFKKKPDNHFEILQYGKKVGI